MKALPRWIVTAIAVVMFAGSAFALDVPSLTGRVVDNAKVLSAEQKREIEKLLEDLERATTAQVVVLTVKSLKGDTPFEFSQRVFDHWKLGQKGKDNGLLISFFVEEKKGRVHTGYGLEGIIPDAERVMLGERLIIPHLPSWRNKKGDDDYYAAIKAGLGRVIALIKEEAKAGDMPPEPKKEDVDFTGGLFLVVVLVAAFASIAHPVVGGVAGGVGFAVVAWILALTLGGIALATLIGFILGLIGWRLMYVVGPVAQVIVGGGGGSGGGGFDF